MVALIPSETSRFRTHQFQSKLIPEDVAWPLKISNLLHGESFSAWCVGLFDCHQKLHERSFSFKLSWLKQLMVRDVGTVKNGYDSQNIVGIMGSNTFYRRQIGSEPVK